MQDFFRAARVESSGLRKVRATASASPELLGSLPEKGSNIDLRICGSRENDAKLITLVCYQHDYPCPFHDPGCELLYCFHTAIAECGYSRSPRL